MSGMTLNFYLPLTSVNNLIAEAPCYISYFSVGVGSPGQVCPLHLHVIVVFCCSLLEYDAVYSGSHMLMFHRGLVPSESPFSETLLHI
jgi:hypothetical protein